MFTRQVKTENGWVRGLPAADPRYTSYKGIPFAAPPVGENRWRAPQPCQDWNGVLLAYDYKPISMQSVPPLEEKNVYTREWSVDPDLEMSEDCLYLNVWAPAGPDAHDLPVYVWYFGGGLQVGHPSEMEFDGERLARRGIVVVTVNYRLNCFGFLCHPEITREAPEAPANFGHLDQQAATRWVKRNIAAFGGDPHNITIGGQSAGGGSVMSQLTSPQNEGLFQRAIVESGVFCKPYPEENAFLRHPSLEAAEKQGVAFFDFLGVKTLAEARAIDEKTLMRKINEYHSFWGTVVDGQFSVGNTLELFRQGKCLQVPVMTGQTSTEFFTWPTEKDHEALKAMAASLFGDRTGEYLALLPMDKDMEEIRRASAVSSIELAIRTMLDGQAQNGSAQPLYYYNFDAEIPGWDHMGTFHSVDLWFFFETLAKCWRPFVGKHYDLARQMCNYWANFIKCGDPNGLDADGSPMPHWDPATAAAPVCMTFTDRCQAAPAPASPMMDFLVRDHAIQYPVK